MSQRARTLAHAARASAPLFSRFLAGFDDTNRTAQAPHLPNHAAWTLAHLALYLNRGAERFDNLPLPEADFAKDRGAAPERFDTESGCFGSTPADEPDRYPPFARCVEIFDNALARFADAVGDLTDNQLDAETSWGSGTITMEDLVIRLTAHTALHAGQLTDLRRALGMPGVIG